MSEYRYAIDPAGSITRARVYRLPDDWSSDNWQHYWDGDFTTAFTIYWRGRPECNGLGGADEDNARAIAAYLRAREHGQDIDDALTRLAFRLTGNWSARFIHVSLEYDSDLYALAWDGDPDNDWRDEIEHVYHGEIYRMEFSVYDPVHSDWPDYGDEWGEEWYGEDKAVAALAEQFPETEFPAELMVEDRAS